MDSTIRSTAFLKTKADTEKAKFEAEKAKYDAMTADEKKAAKDARKTAMEAQKSKIDAMTDAEKKAYFEANKPVRDNVLADLVTAGIFTQAQADTIQTAMKAAMPQKHEIGKERGETSKKRANTNGASTTVTE